MKLYRLVIDYNGHITITECTKYVSPNGFITYSSRTVYEGPENEDCIPYQNYLAVYKYNNFIEMEKKNETKQRTNRTSRRLSSKTSQEQSSGK